MSHYESNEKTDLPLTEVADLLRKRLDVDGSLLAVYLEGKVSEPHICWATDALSAYQQLLPQLLDQIDVIEKKIERLSDVHRRLILAVTPGSDSFLYAQGPKTTIEDKEAYNALFSEWHSATRDLRKLVEE